jgi:hypothetical protein
MKLLMISAFAAVALFATTTLRSHSPATDSPAVTAGMMSLQDLYRTADVNKLPIEEFEDQSLVYSTKR